MYLCIYIYIDIGVYMCIDVYKYWIYSPTNQERRQLVVTVTVWGVNPIPQITLRQLTSKSTPHVAGFKVKKPS